MIGELVLGALVAVTCLVLLPALAVGGVAAELMRRRGLRWTWTLPPLVVCVIPLALLGDEATAGVRGAVDHALAGRADPVEIAWAGAPWWLAASCLVTAGWKLRRDREDRYHGGERARRLARERGPLTCARQALVRRGAPAAGAYVAGRGVRVGSELDSGRPVFVPPPRSMVTLIGAAGAGKTTLATTLVEGLVDHGASLTVLDAKGSRALARRCLELAERHGRSFALVSLEPFGEEDLDRHRVSWNVVGYGNPTEVKDTILAAEDFSEPYYRTTGERGVLAAASCLAAEGERPNAATLAELLQDPAGLADRLELVDGYRLVSEAAWLAELTKGELSALRGIASKLARLIQSEGGERLVPDESALDLEVAMRTGRIVLFSLPASAYPEHAPQLSRYLTQQVNAVCGRITFAGRAARAVFWIDDASGLAAGQLPALYERAREAGVVVMTAVQSLSNLSTLGGERLHAAALEDAELVAVLRQSLPAAAAELAALAGVEETYEHAHEVGESSGWLGLSDETGRRTRRRVERPTVPAEAIARMGTGEAVLISRREGLSVERIRIERAVT
ncbi:MAG: ATP-binding protein [Actinobacteria bacterium]|nr:ATP-binding protein [Actinomycetota bacterium]